MTYTFTPQTALQNNTIDGYAQISIAGIGTASFNQYYFHVSDPTTSYDADIYQNGALVQFQPMATDHPTTLFEIYNPVLANYDFATAIGPISSLPYTDSFIYPTSFYSTTLGYLHLTSATPETFTAELATPEPSEALLLLAGFAACAGFRLAKVVCGKSA